MQEYSQIRLRPEGRMLSGRPIKTLKQTTTVKSGRMTQANMARWMIGWRRLSQQRVHNLNLLPDRNITSGRCVTEWKR